MERAMPCAICGKKLGRFACIKCGRLVCGECFDSATGICKGCILRFK
ncbi:MAG: B-box zinc finger protein [Candidatus Nanoarchaeia archaeon]|nr:B-box zinc finger protein [Candidatus Nanoarchaeia archaeon]